MTLGSFFVYLAVSFFSALNAYAASSSVWAQLASSDLDAIHQIIRTNHPGMVDAHNPQFKIQLENEYKSAKKMLGSVKTYPDYQYILSNFINSFHDGHLNLYFSLSEKQRSYPGFLVHYQNNQFIIAQSILLPNEAR